QTRRRQRCDRQVPAHLVVDIEREDRHRAGEDPHLRAEAPHHQAGPDRDPLGRSDLDQESPVLFLWPSRGGLHRPEAIIPAAYSQAFNRPITTLYAATLSPERDLGETS